MDVKPYGKKCLLVFLMVLAVFSSSFVLAAQEMYVTDILYVSVRSEPSMTSNRLKLLQSNQKLTVLETEGEFARVRTEDGTEGWVQKQYLTKKKPLPQKIRDKEKKIDQLQKEKVLLETKLSELTKNSSRRSAVLPEPEMVAGLKKQIAALQKTNKRLAEESATARKVKENQLIKTEGTGVDPTRAELYRERQSGRVQWFLAGAFVFFCGWIVGRMSAGRTRKNTISF